MTTEKRLIDANALNDAIEVTDWYHISPKGYLQKGANSQIHTPLFKADDIFQALKDAPTVDAVEVVHGRWEDMYGGHYVNPRFRCSVCNEKALYKFVRDMLGNYKEVQELTPYCPYCGAKMDGDGNG